MARVRVLQVVQIGGRRYGPGKAREAASQYASEIAYKFTRNGTGFRDYNEWHKIAFHRSLFYFEKILGVVSNRKNPRQLIELDLVNDTVTMVDN
jgi:hypothetical protein